jgi:hypothetical protein
MPKVVIISEPKATPKETLKTTPSKVTQRTIIKRAVKQGVRDSLFYLWLKHSENPKHLRLYEVWSNTDLLWKETQTENSEYGIQFWEEIRGVFEEQVKVIKEEKTKHKKRKKKKKKKKKKEKEALDEKQE